MGYGIGKKDNEYARLVLHIDAPKTVWMAIAVSFANRLEDGIFAEVPGAIQREWATLHLNGIVPQKVRISKRRDPLAP